MANLFIIVELKFELLSRRRFIYLISSVDALSMASSSDSIKKLLIPVISFKEMLKKPFGVVLSNLQS